MLGHGPHLPLRGTTATVRFSGSPAACKQLATADGLITYAQRATPPARYYWTLSAWTDNTALREFMRTLRTSS